MEHLKFLFQVEHEKLVRYIGTLSIVCCSFSDLLFIKEARACLLKKDHLTVFRDLIRFKAPLEERRVSGDRMIGMVLSCGDSLHARAFTTLYRRSCSGPLRDLTLK